MSTIRSVISPVIQGVANTVASSSGEILPPTEPPTITLNPLNVVAIEGEHWQMTTSAKKYDSVKWQLSDDNVTYVDATGFDGASELTPTIYQDAADIALDFNFFKALYTNLIGTSETQPALLRVVPPSSGDFLWGDFLVGDWQVGAPPPPPVITLDPVDQSGNVGDVLTYTTNATDYTNVQWYWLPVGASIWNVWGGQTLPDVDSDPLALVDDGILVRARYINTGGFTETDSARMTVLTPLPVITLNPVDQSVSQGSTGTFTADATGYDSVQWQKDAVDIAGATAISYTTPAVIVGDDGAAFHAIFTNGGGSVPTTSAVLTVV